MKFHGRLSPGVLDDPEQVVQLLLHTPKQCDGVTLKIWELDTFVQGEEKSEGSEDDLLAEFQGSIESGEGDRGSADWRRFVVSESKILSEDPELVRFKLQLPGSEEIYEIPIISEEGEVEGGTYELGFSLEVGGEEVFKSNAPCFYTPPRGPLRIVVRWFSQLGRDQELEVGSVVEEYLMDVHVVIGVLGGEPGPEATLKVLGSGYVDGDGYLVPAQEGDSGPLGALLLRGSRELFLFSDDEPIAERGETSIPLPACDRVTVDEEAGVFFVSRYDPVDPMSFGVAELPMEGVHDHEDPEAAQIVPREIGGIPDQRVFLERVNVIGQEGSS